MKVVNSNQIRSLDAMKPYSVKFAGRWFWVKSLEDVKRALAYRDKKTKIEDYKKERKTQRGAICQKKSQSHKKSQWSLKG